MALSEVDSFILKFKNLLKSGKNTHLDIKSEAGKVSIELTVEVDLLTLPRIFLHLEMDPLVSVGVKDEQQRELQLLKK